jgi:peptide/nickel transport system substrate-binding protein
MTDSPKRWRLGTTTRFGAVAVALALATSACSGSAGGEDAPATASGENPAPQGEPQQGGSIIVGLEAETNGWLPGTANLAQSGYNVMYSIYDSLMARKPDGSYAPYLAETVEPNAEFTTWTVKLREGVTFHDGSPLTAEVIQQNVAIMKEPTSTIASVLSEVGTVEVLDPLTVRYNLVSPNASFPTVLGAVGGMPFSMANYQALGKDGANSQPVGTGPFTFESWQRDAELVLAANEDYWGTDMGLGPYLDELVFRPIPDEDTRLQSLVAGGVQAVHSIRAEAIVQARDEDDLALHTFVGNPGASTIFNTAVAPMDDVRVRRALSLATDQEQIIAVQGGTGVQTPKTQYYGEDSPYFSEKVADAYPAFDAEAAEELLQEYVDDPDRSDGKPAGTPVALTYSCPPDPGLLELAQAIQAFWSNIGVDVNLDSVDQATHIQEALGSPADTPPLSGDWQAKCWRSGYEVDPFNLFKLELTTPAANPINFPNYTSDTIQEQVGLLASEGDVDEQAASAEKIGLDLAENMPLMWAGSTVTMIATDPSVQNISNWQMPDGSDGIGSGLYGGGVTMWGQVWVTE